MKKIFFFFLLTILISVPAWSGAKKTKDADEKGKVLLVQGILVDSSCYFKEGQRADEHDGMAACGKDCLAGGVPAGVLVGDKLYILIFPARAFAPYVGQTVEIKGEPFADNLLHPQKASVLTKDGKQPIKLDGFEMM